MIGEPLRGAFSAIAAFGKDIMEMTSRFDKGMEEIKRVRNQIEEDKMGTTFIRYDDLVLAGADQEAKDRWHRDFGLNRVAFGAAYDWLKQRPDCWLGWVKKNESGNVPQSWLDYIAEREKPPCDGCWHEIPGSADCKHPKAKDWDIPYTAQCGGPFEKPSVRTVEEIIRDGIGMLHNDVVTPDDFQDGPKHATWDKGCAELIALAANNFAKDRKVMKSVIAGLDQRHMPDTASNRTLMNIRKVLQGRLDAHYKQVTEME